MSDFTKTNTTKKTNPAKLVLIPVLGATLLGIILWPDKNAEHDSAKVNPATSTDLSITGAQDSITKKSKPWPEISLEETLAFNPFAWKIEDPQIVESPETQGTVKPIESVPNPEDIRLNQIIASLSSKKASAIFQSRRGPAAIIDTHVVHVGDHLAEGFQIVEISSLGVKLQFPNGTIQIPAP